MRYFVVADDGQKYGPADVPTLQSWIDENRLLANQQVEEEGSGIRMAASAIPGLRFPAPPTPVTPPGPGGPQQPMGGAPYQGAYNRPQMPAAYDDGKNDVILAWVFGVIGCGCCFSAIAGIYFGNRAVAKGNASGNAARIFAWIVLILGLILGVIRAAVVVSAIKSGQVPQMPPQ